MFVMSYETDKVITCAICDLFPNTLQKMELLKQQMHWLVQLHGCKLNIIVTQVVVMTA